jgi:hypothetical protein
VNRAGHALQQHTRAAELHGQGECGVVLTWQDNREHADKERDLHHKTHPEQGQHVGEAAGGLQAAVVCAYDADLAVLIRQVDCIEHRFHD